MDLERLLGVVQHILDVDRNDVLGSLSFLSPSSSLCRRGGVARHKAASPAHFGSFVSPHFGFYVIKIKIVLLDLVCRIVSANCELSDLAASQAISRQNSGKPADHTMETKLNFSETIMEIFQSLEIMGSFRYITNN